MRADRRQFLRGCLVALGFAVAPTALVGAPKRDRWIEIDLSDRPLPELDMDAYIAEIRRELEQSLRARFAGHRIVDAEVTKRELIDAYREMAESYAFEVPKIECEFDHATGTLNLRADLQKMSLPPLDRKVSL